MKRGNVAAVVLVALACVRRGELDLTRIPAQVDDIENGSFLETRYVAVGRRTSIRPSGSW